MVFYRGPKLTRLTEANFDRCSRAPARARVLSSFSTLFPLRALFMPCLGDVNIVRGPISELLQAIRAVERELNAFSLSPPLSSLSPLGTVDRRFKMKAATELAISLGSIFGFIALGLSLAFARFSFRKHRTGRATPVDPVYEDQLNLVRDNDEANGGGGGRKTDEKKKKRWFGGKYGLSPVAEPGPRGTKQYLSGWFALDSPTHAGWGTSSDTDGKIDGDEKNRETASVRTSRESHFSRASRASRRSSKKVPRPSRTTELGALEHDDSVVREQEEKGTEAVTGEREKEESQRLGEQ